MSRLTKRFEDNSGYEPIENHNVCNINLYDFNFDDYDRCVEKLGKLEDLAEKLGCPLEVIIEATRKDIIDRKGIRHSVLYGGLYLFSLEDDELTNIFSLKDYQKTWWLPENEEGFKNE